MLHEEIMGYRARETAPYHASQHIDAFSPLHAEGVPQPQRESARRSASLVSFAVFAPLPSSFYQHMDVQVGIPLGRLSSTIFCIPPVPACILDELGVDVTPHPTTE
jgi:hypothetical protein